MTIDNMTQRERKLHQLQGALELLFSLREELAQWLEEAQDASKKEALENVLGHIEAIELEYQGRLAELRNARHGG
jgi:hypothetical protein